MFALLLTRTTEDIHQPVTTRLSLFNMASLMYWIGIVSATTVTSITYLGAFSRFTHGRFTPRFYAYQIDRAPDNASTRVVPYIDVTLATLTLFATTRPIALLICTGFQAFGITLRLREGKDMTPDVALCAIAAVASWSSFASQS